jgi:hypothetical protein
MTIGKIIGKLSECMWKKNKQWMPKVASVATKMTQAPAIGPLVRRVLFKPDMTPRNIPILVPALSFCGSISPGTIVGLAKRSIDVLKLVEERRAKIADWTSRKAAISKELNAAYERLENNPKDAEASALTRQLLPKSLAVDLEIESERIPRKSTRPQIQIYSRISENLLRTKYATYFYRIINLVEEANKTKPKYYPDMSVPTSLARRFREILNQIAKKVSSPDEFTQVSIEIFNYLARAEESFNPSGLLFSEVVLTTLGTVHNVDLKLYNEVVLAFWMDTPGLECMPSEELLMMGKLENFRRLFAERIKDLESSNSAKIKYAKAWMEFLNVNIEDIEIFREECSDYLS